MRRPWGQRGSARHKQIMSERKRREGIGQVGGRAPFHMAVFHQSKTKRLCPPNKPTGQRCKQGLIIAPQRVEEEIESYRHKVPDDRGSSLAVHITIDTSDRIHADPGCYRTPLATSSLVSILYVDVDLELDLRAITFEMLSRSRNYKGTGFYYLFLQTVWYIIIESIYISCWPGLAIIRSMSLPPKQDDQER